MVCKVVVQYVDAQARFTFCIATNCNLPSFCCQRHNYLFPSEKGVFTVYSVMICAWKNIVWQLFQAIQLIQISSNYVEVNIGKTRCVPKSVRPLEFDSCCRQRSISQTSLWPRHWLTTHSESIVRVHVESRKCPWSGWPWVFGSLICNFEKTVTSQVWRVVSRVRTFKLRRKRCHCRRGHCQALR